MKKEIKIGSVFAKPGEKVAGEIEIGRLANRSKISLPLIIINGQNEGPNLWLNAAVHGNELNGIFVISEIVKKVDPKKITGSLICTPISNPLAFQGRNQLTPLDIDGLNLDECFPGNPHGQVTERIAYILFDSIKKNADYLIDFHACGFSGRTAKPYAVFKLTGNSEIDKKTEEMAKIFGTHLVCKIDLKKKLSEPHSLSGSLDLNCNLNHIPSFMLEIGHAGRLEKDIVQFAYQGTKNIMKYLGIISGEPILTENQIILTERQIIRCNCSGLAIVDVKPHDFIRKGERVAHIVNLFGDIVEEITAPKDVYAITLRLNPVVNIGDRIAFVGSI